MNFVIWKVHFFGVAPAKRKYDSHYVSDTVGASQLANASLSCYLSDITKKSRKCWQSSVTCTTHPGPGTAGAWTLDTFYSVCRYFCRPMSWNRCRMTSSCSIQVCMMSTAPTIRMRWCINRLCVWKDEERKLEEVWMETRQKYIMWIIRKYFKRGLR